MSFGGDYADALTERAYDEMRLSASWPYLDHFLAVSWGPVIPPGEACLGIEATKGNNGYYLVSDGTESAYRNRIRSPSFPHLQVLPLMAEHFEIPDLITILGSIDFVMADVDR